MILYNTVIKNRDEKDLEDVENVFVMYECSCMITEWRKKLSQKNQFKIFILGNWRRKMKIAAEVIIVKLMFIEHLMQNTGEVKSISKK